MKDALSPDDAVKKSCLVDDAVSACRMNPLFDVAMLIFLCLTGLIIVTDYITHFKALVQHGLLCIFVCATLYMIFVSPRRAIDLHFIRPLVGVIRFRETKHFRCYVLDSEPCFYLSVPPDTFHLHGAKKFGSSSLSSLITIGILQF